ncbi:MAG: tail fiber domain-containing protein, partial [Candidatus Marinimicrobia bacterium]|nr:tail fiber domain-containing protein [Candidatus Neomarinimicrobiota bacterium]
AGTITNGIGLYIGDINATNQYAIYQSGASDTNYFAGRMGIGTLDPAYKLHVNGTAYATGAAGALSDERHKNNITTINNGLETILNLNPVSFNWIDPIDSGMEGTQLGFIAQEVETVVPSIVLTQENEEMTKGLKYTEFIPLAIKGIQEQNELITTNSNNLTTRATATSVSSLQTLVDTQLLQTSNILDKIQNDIDTNETNILSNQVKANDNANLIEELNLTLQNAQAGISLLNTMGATDLERLTELLSINPDTLLFTEIDENDNTILILNGIIVATTLQVDNIETRSLSVDDAVVGEDDDGEELNASMIGTATIKKGKTEAVVETMAVNEGSRVFITAKTITDKNISVNEVNSDSGFVASIATVFDKDIIFDWFIIGDK